MDKLYRQWLMLHLIPTAPRKIDCASMEKKLREAGYDISLRTIQRDLMKLSLSEVFPIIYDDRSIPYGWSWMKDGAIFNIPTMNPHTALTFMLLDKHLPNVLPPSTRDALKPYISNAGKILNKLSGTKLHTWPDKVHVVSRSFQLAPPIICPVVLESVFEGVLKERKISFSYRRREDIAFKTYSDVNPLALVCVDNLIYLLGSIRKHDNPLQFLLHRMESVEILNRQAYIASGFTLQGYISSGEFSYPTGEGTVRLKALFDKEEAIYLHETRFPGELVLEETEDEMVLLEAEIEDSYQLRRWLLNFGDGVEILEPASLRKNFADIANNMWQMYKN